MRRKIANDLMMYLKLIQITMRGMLEYRGDFLSSLLGVFVLNGANLAQISVLTWRFTQLGEWTIGDLMILYGLYSICWSIFVTFFGRVRNLDDEIAAGTFDQYLFRPMSPFLQLIGRQFNYTGLCDLLFGVLLLCVGYTLTEVNWMLPEVLLLMGLVLSGVVIMVAIQVIVSSLSFWTVRTSGLRDSIMQLTLLTQKYPLAIFPKAFISLATWFVPIAYINYYPAALLLGKSGHPAWIPLTAPLVMVGWLAIAACIWRGGIRRYGSAGG